MIRIIRFANILPVLLFLTFALLKFVVRADIGLYQIGIILVVTNFLMDLFLAHTLKEKVAQGEILVFTPTKPHPMFWKWLFIVIGIIIFLLIIMKHGDIQGWFWFTLIISKGIEHYIHIKNWNVIIENKELYKRGFWMKPILISEIDKTAINTQDQLELTTPNGLQTLKLDSGISVPLEQAIKKIQADQIFNV